MFIHTQVLGCKHLKNKNLCRNVNKKDAYICLFMVCRLDYIWYVTFFDGK